MELAKTTITTLEVAEMMETEHWKILRKLDGMKGRDGEHKRGYIEILDDNKIVVVDFFIKSSYVDEKGERRPCYEVTKMGCDFLANKFNGEKGILFTAKYVKRFHEMEKGIGTALPRIDPVVASSAAQLSNTIIRIMRMQEAAPHEIAGAVNTICSQLGIYLPAIFVKKPAYEQINFLGSE